jgi:ABC-type glycerol-3-phosphate transport system substrate-binding protein
LKAKKVLSLIISALMVGSIFTGCGGKKNNTASNAQSSTKAEEKAEKKEKVTITYWQHSSAARDEMMKELADEFMKENQDIEVKMEFIPFDSYFTKLISSLSTDAAPDVMQVKSGMITRFANSGTIQPLDENILTTDNIKNEFMPSSVDALKYDGKYYGLPTDVQTIVLYWNKALAKEAGLVDAEKGPQTWDELIDWAKKLTKFDNGQMMQSGWGEKGYPFEIEALVAQNGGKMVDENGKFVFADDPKSSEAIKYFVDAYKVHKVYDLKFMKNWAGFRQGKVAMMLGHPAMLGNLKQTAPDVELGIGLVPKKNDRNTTIVTSWAYAISKKANSEAATRWVEFLTSEKIEKKWTEKTGELPARKALLNDADLTKDPNVKRLLSSINDSETSYLQTSALYDIWKKGYEKLILTDESFEDNLKQMQKDLNAEIAKDLK